MYLMNTNTNLTTEQVSGYYNFMVRHIIYLAGRGFAEDSPRMLRTKAKRDAAWAVYIHRLNGLIDRAEKQL